MHLEKGFKALHASWNSNTADQNVKLSLMLWIATQKVNTNVSSLSLALEIFCSNLSTLKINWQPLKRNSPKEDFLLFCRLALCNQKWLQDQWFSKWHLLYLYQPAKTFWNANGSLPWSPGSSQSRRKTLVNKV